MASSSSSRFFSVMATPKKLMMMQQPSKKLMVNLRRYPSVVLHQQQRWMASSMPPKKESSSMSSLFDSPSSFWASLRRQAATALTASLTAKEQQELLEKMGHSVFATVTTKQESEVKTKSPSQATEKGKQDDDDKVLVLQKSIEEAVAEARIQEAKMQTEKWNKEKEKLFAEAEKAARKRVENELRVQKFQQWQNEVNAAKQNEETAASSSNSTTAPVVQEEKDAIAPVKNAVTAVEVVAPQEEDEAAHHPILGKPLIDLGYKRVHLVSAKQLATIQVWKKQRIYRHKRAENMAQDKLKTLHLGMPGVIGLHENQQGILSIIDGQHRVGMMSILLEKNPDSDIIDLDRVLVEVYPELPGHDDHAADLFSEVNKAEPVKLVDMPGVAKAKDRQVITDGAEKLHKSFPNMFSENQKCRIPHLNVDNMRDNMFAASVLKRHDIKSASQLETWLLEQNERMAEKYKPQEMQESVPKAAMTKATTNKFYLGLDSSWYYN